MSRFLWVRLQLETLCRVSECRRDEEVHSALASLPEGLEATYSSIAQQIGSKPEYLRSLAMRSLELVIYAQRPLIAEELQFALATLDEGQDFKKSDVDGLDVIVAASANLIVLESVGQLISIVRLAHYSVLEYFTTHDLASVPTFGSRLLDKSKAHNNLARICMSHLRQPMLYTGGNMENLLVHERLTRDPFLQYAAEYFDKHIVLGEHASDHQISEFLESGPTFLNLILCTRAMDRCSWVRHYLFAHVYRVHEEKRRVILSIMGVSGKFVEAATKCAWSAATMVDITLLGQLPDIRQRYASTEGAVQALHYACQSARKSEIEKLLDRGVDQNAPDGYGRTALAIALQTYEPSIHIILAQRGADANARDHNGLSVLQAAAMKSDSVTVRQLLENEAKVNAQGGEWANALYAVACRGDTHEDERLPITRMLLEHGADVNARGGRWVTALAASAVHGHVDQVEILLSYGATVYQPEARVEIDELGAAATFSAVSLNLETEIPNALHLACLVGYSRVVEILLDHGANVNWQGGPHVNAMFAALEQDDHDDVVALLIKRGFHLGLDTLTTAASRGRIESLREILSPEIDGPGFNDTDIGLAIVAARESKFWPYPSEEKGRETVINLLQRRMASEVELGSEDESESGSTLEKMESILFGV